MFLRLSVCAVLFMSCSTKRPVEEAPPTSNKIEVKKGQTEKTKNQEFLVFDNIYVTGEDTYGLDEIVIALDLENYLSQLDKDDKIISIGEGVSQLVEVGLRKQRSFPNSYSLDPLYAETNFPDSPSGRQAAEYVKRNEGYLLPFYSDNTKQKSGEYSLVLSHMLVNNLLYHGGKFAVDATLRELYRITKTGGNIVILGFQILDKIKKMLQEKGEDWPQLEKSAWRKAALKKHVESLLMKSEVSVEESVTNPNLYLLKIKKTL